MKKFILSLLISFCTLFIIRYYFWGYVLARIPQSLYDSESIQTGICVFLVVLLFVLIFCYIFKENCREKLGGIIGRMSGFIIGLAIVIFLHAYHNYGNVFPTYFKFGDLVIKEICSHDEALKKNKKQKGKYYQTNLLDKNCNLIIKSFREYLTTTYLTIYDSNYMQDAYVYIHTRFEQDNDEPTHHIDELYMYDDSYDLYTVYEIDYITDYSWEDYMKESDENYKIEEDSYVELVSLESLIEKHIGEIDSGFYFSGDKKVIFCGITERNAKSQNNAKVDIEETNDEEYSEPTSEKHSSNTNYEPEYGLRDEWVDCMTCHGSGKCPYCHGEGRDFVTNYSGDILSIADCNICHTSGVCQSCAGTKGHYEKRRYQIR